MKLNPTWSLNNIASFLKTEYIGDPNFVISGINEIHCVANGDITFVDHPKYYEKAINSNASTIIINKKIDCPEGKALIFSKDPFSDYTALVKMFRPFIPCSSSVSPLAKIGENTIIQPNTFVGNNVVIGNNCVIHANVCIYDYSAIGDNVIIHSGTVIGADAFYYKRRPDGYDKLLSCGRVVIEDNVEIGANCTIDKGVSADTIIGKGSKLDNLIQIGHDTILGKNTLIASQSGVAGVSILEDDVTLWAQVGIQKDITIRKGTVVLAQSGVAKSTKEGGVYFGSPAQDAIKKKKELAMIKMLPFIIEKIKNL